MPYRSSFQGIYGSCMGFRDVGFRSYIYISHGVANEIDAGSSFWLILGNNRWSITETPHTLL